MPTGRGNAKVGAFGERVGQLWLAGLTCSPVVESAPFWNLLHQALALPLPNPATLQSWGK